MPPSNWPSFNKPDYRDVRSFEADFAHAAMERFGERRCPCCRGPMLKHRKRVQDYSPRRRTVGHDVPVGFGGRAEDWIYICAGCNGEQGNLSFRQWAAVLSVYKDERAAFVTEVADLLDELRGRKAA